MNHQSQNQSLFRAASLAVLILASGCNSAPTYTVRKLSSGREVKLLSMMPIRFGNGSSALMLKYQTDLDMSDKQALQKEVNEIWTVFQNDVEKGGFGSGIISANHEPKGFIFKH